MNNREQSMIRAVAFLILGLIAGDVATAQYYARIGNRNYPLNSNGYCCNNRSCPMRAEAHRQFLAQTQYVSSVTPQQAMKAVDSKWVPMPYPVVDAMLGVMDIQRGETLYDLGCGDGRILSTANAKYDASVLGIELNPDTWQAATARMKADRCQGWRIVRGDATEFSLAGADIITLYLYPHTMRDLQWDTLKPGARVISYQHPIPGLTTELYRCEIDGEDHEFFIHYH